MISTGANTLVFKGPEREQEITISLFFFIFEHHFATDASQIRCSFTKMANKEEKKPLRLNSLPKLIQEHLETSSAPGLSNIKRSTNRFGKIFWTSLVCFSFTIVCFQTIQLYNEFKAYPIRVTSTYEYNRSLQFPAVTICNLNPLRSSMINGDSDAAAVFGRQLQLLNQPSTKNGGQPGGQPKPPHPPQPPHEPKSTPPQRQPLSTPSLNTEKMSTHKEVSSEPKYDSTFDMTTLPRRTNGDKV